jgi:hypothetical protein
MREPPPFLQMFNLRGSFFAPFAGFSSRPSRLKAFSHRKSSTLVSLRALRGLFFASVAVKSFSPTVKASTPVRVLSA